MRVKRYRDPNGKVWEVAAPPGNPGQPSIFGGWPFVVLWVALLIDIDRKGW